jgi:hypothetical protein
MNRAPADGVSQTMLDLSEIPIVDNHCHGLFAEPGALTVADYRHRFSECAGEPFPPDHTSTAPHYLWALRQVAGVLGCDPDEESVLARRAELDDDELAARFLRSVNIDWLLVDDGYPDPAQVLPREDLAARGGFRVGWVEREEVVAGRLTAEHERFADFDEALVEHLDSARDRGVISFKSVAAYRSGLMIERPSRADAKAAFKQMHRDGSERLERKPLVDHVVHRVMEAASDQELPVQFHTGYGDADADLRLADPFHLAPLAREYPDVNLVLLHGGYPFSGHLAVLAATYANIYADVSYGIPFLTSHQLYTVTHTLLGPAPASRVLYSSDAVGIPEQHWLGAVRGRRAIGAALGDMVVLGDITATQARGLAELILRGNAVRIYDL